MNTEEIVRLYKAGVTIRNISKITGIKFDKVSRIIYIEQNLPRRNKPLGADDVAKIHRMKLEGMKIREIAQELVLPMHKVKDALYRGD